ncbi:MAG: hypothetical protein EWV68_11745 [Microcystis sp. M_QC_C_20170808_M9Col]|nr:MAG: hypothetical protein EWV68_11745 [Microcystis sp. M_QC_C_20170808_M9Col]
MILPAINRISCVRVWVGRNYNNGFNEGKRQKAKGKRQKAKGKRQKAKGKRQKAKGSFVLPTPHTPHPHPTPHNLPLITDN